MAGNYEKDLFKQLQETIEELDKLTEEMNAMKSAHRNEVIALKSEVAKASKQNSLLKAENKKLKDMINEDNKKGLNTVSSDQSLKIRKSGKKIKKCPSEEAEKKII